MQLCNKCGAQNSDETKFCRSCGATLRQPEPSPAPKPPQKTKNLPESGKKGSNVAIICIVAFVVVALTGILAVAISHQWSRSKEAEENVQQGTTAPAQTTTEDLPRYYVTGTEQSLDLRTEIGESGGDVLAQLANGTAVGLVRTDESAFWYVYVYDLAQYGYVRKQYLTEDTEAVTAATVCYVTAEAAPLFDGATAQNQTGQLKKGDRLTVLACPTGKYWFVYAAEQGVFGYVENNALGDRTQVAGESSTGNLTGEGKAPEKTLGDFYVNGVSEYLALRREQSYDSANEIGKLPNGTRVQVISQQGTYWYIYAPTLGMYGYANGDYLTEQRAAKRSAAHGDTYTVVGVDAYLALRTACAYSPDNEIGRIYAGQTVEFLRDGTDGYWYVYVPSLDNYGYVNSDFLK